jgi:hypothetical protein
MRKIVMMIVATAAELAPLANACAHAELDGVLGK